MITLRNSHTRIYIAADIDDDHLAALNQVLAALVVIASAVLMVSRGVVVVAVFCGDVVEAAGLVWAEVVGVVRLEWWPVVGMG